MKRTGMEKRLFSRKLIRTKVVFDDEFSEGLIYLFTEDISMGGLFISSDIPIKIRSYVFISFYLPGGKTLIRATGQVVRISKKEVSPGVQERQGMGIRFVGLSPEASAAIQEYVV